MTEFQYSGYAQEIIFEPGSLTRLSEAVDRFHWRRVMLCASNSARRSGRIAAIETALGDRLVAIYDHAQAHVPDFQVTDAAALAVECQIDAVIGLGGGSPIGLAKAVSQTVEEKRSGHLARSASPTDQPLISVIAIPTTYAGSEMTPVYGITHHADGSSRKITVTDPKITPRLVIYDPRLTFDLPPDVTASSGINALAHCVEAVYSITRHPLSTAAALSGAQHIVRALPRCHAVGDDEGEACTEMLIGAHLAAVAQSSVTMGLHHGLCHALGGTAGVPHGIANAIVLPHAMRFNVDTTAPQLAQLAVAIRLPINNREAESAEAAAQKIDDLIKQLNLPQRLRDVGINRSDLPQIAQVALQSRAVQNNPKPIRDAAQIEALLDAMW